MMKARLATSLAMFSAALTVIVAAGWIRSLSSTDLITYQYVRQTHSGLRGMAIYQYGASGGGNFIKQYEATYPTILTSSPRSSNDGWQWSVLPAPGRRFFGGLGGGSWARALGFAVISGRGFHSGIGKGTFTVTIARFPHWFVLLLTLPLLALSLRRVMHDRHRIRRRRMGLCERCGYDLRVSPGSCPECGMERS